MKWTSEGNEAFVKSDLCGETKAEEISEQQLRTEALWRSDPSERTHSLRSVGIGIKRTTGDNVDIVSSV